MIIQELKPSQRIKGRWLAVLEDGGILRIGENEVIDFALYTGKELTDEEAEGLQKSAQNSALREKTIELLTRKPMSRRELERKMEQWEADETQILAICDRMEELGFLNDEEYAIRVVRHYSMKGYGERKVRDELYRRGVPREFWDEALSRMEDPAETLDAFVSKKLAGKTPDPKELKKVSDALARRGYGWSDISEAMARFGARMEEEL